MYIKFSINFIDSFAYTKHHCQPLKNVFVYTFGKTVNRIKICICTNRVVMSGLLLFSYSKTFWKLNFNKSTRVLYRDHTR